MSLAVQKLKPWKVVDPRMNIKQADKYLFKQPAKRVTYSTTTASSASNNSLHFSCQPPGPTTVISRLVYITAKFFIAIPFTDPANGNAAVDGTAYFCGTPGKNYVCPRQFPLASVMQNVQAKINSDSVNTDPHRFIHALGRYNLDGLDRDGYMSTTPSQPDAFQNYNDGAHLGYGELRSPFSSFGEVSGEIPRGAYTFENVAYDAGTGLTYAQLVITEPLFLSPFSGGSYNLMGFVQVTNMDVTVAYTYGKVDKCYLYF